jgi:hypothetical protein
MSAEPTCWVSRERVLGVGACLALRVQRALRRVSGRWRRAWARAVRRSDACGARTACANALGLELGLQRGDRVGVSRARRVRRAEVGAHRGERREHRVARHPLAVLGRARPLRPHA